MRLFYCILSLLFLSACSAEYQKKELTDFNGTWKVVGNSTLQDIQFSIQIDGKKVKSEIVNLNENKWVNQFSEVGDKWISSVERESNFQFKISEKRIGSGIFSLYDLPSSNTYFAQFAHQDTLCLSTSKNKVLKSQYRYIRIK